MTSYGTCEICEEDEKYLNNLKECEESEKKRRKNDVNN